MRFGLLFVVLLGLDQLTKYVATICFQHPVEILYGVIDLVYLRNRGAAFGILQNQQSFFIGLSILVSVALLFWLYKTKSQPKSPQLYIAICFFLAGTIGNMVDRLWHGYVIDFISVGTFPVFNFADIFINIGVVGLVALANRFRNLNSPF